MGPPFRTPSCEMVALQRRGDYYVAKAAQLRTKKPMTDLIRREIRYLEHLNHGCQQAIAKYFANGVRPYEQNDY